MINKNKQNKNQIMKMIGKMFLIVVIRILLIKMIKIIGLMFQRKLKINLEVKQYTSLKITIKQKK